MKERVRYSLFRLPWSKHIRYLANLKLRPRVWTPTAPPKGVFFDIWVFSVSQNAEKTQWFTRTGMMNHSFIIHSMNPRPSLPLHRILLSQQSFTLCQRPRPKSPSQRILLRQWPSLKFLSEPHPFCSSCRQAVQHAENIGWLLNMHLHHPSCHDCKAHGNMASSDSFVTVIDCERLLEPCSQTGACMYGV